MTSNKSLNPFASQEAFMLAADQSTRRYNREQTELYINLMVEEFTEAVQASSLEDYVKELCDLLVVTIGTLHSIGVDPQELWDRVWDSNMSKLPFTKREDGKIQKGPNYQPPVLGDLLEAIPNLAESDLVRELSELDEALKEVDDVVGIN